MQFNPSNIVSVLSWMAVAIATFATAFWISIVVDGNYVWSAFGFALMATLVGVAMLLLAVIPGSILYVRTRERRDLISLSLAGCSFVLVLVEAVLLWIIPMRGE